MNDLGIPDLSLVTIDQMIEELSKRDLAFLLMWVSRKNGNIQCDAVASIDEMKNFSRAMKERQII